MNLRILHLGRPLCHGLAAVALAAFATLATPAVAEPAARPLKLDPVELDGAALELDGQTEAKAAVIVLHASNDCEQIEEKIPAEARDKLKEPPFSAYSCYKLLKQSDVAFSTTKAGELELPNKGKLTLELNGVDDKYDIQLTVSKGGKKTLSANVKAKKGKIFFVAGPKHQGGILVLGLSIS